MKKICSLTSLKIGQSAHIYKLDSDFTIKRRLQDIGLIEGTHVKCVLKSPFGDPVAYQIKGAVIALRNEDSDKIQICL